ncbi:MAG TPA: hypothetical protein VK474_03535 [Chthoniobacterales bacterium]|nr:hypothetical protein [Chthoniobacterales bacterium]
MKLPALLASCSCAGSLLAQTSTPSAPPLEPASPHRHEVEERGDAGMGFSHRLTGHHFCLLPDGGAIAVAANDPEDAKSRDAIRTHLAMIAGMFTEGNFSIPMFVHASVPPGAATMKELRSEITYDAERTENGAQVTIRTRNPKAVEAIHQFLRFQITDHHTGDPLEVRK